MREGDEWEMSEDSKWKWKYWPSGMNEVNWEVDNDEKMIYVLMMQLSFLLFFLIKNAMLKIMIETDMWKWWWFIYVLSYIILDSVLSSEGHMQEYTQTFNTYVFTADLNKRFQVHFKAVKDFTIH